MAAAVYPHEPGSQYGPCAEPCEHKDCQKCRADSEKKCRICKKPIGYGNRTYMQHGQSPDYDLAHADCFEDEIEKPRPFKAGSRVEVLAARLDHPSFESWQLGRIVASGGYDGNQYWSVHLDDHTNPLDTISVPKGQAKDRLVHSDTPMPDKTGQLTERQKQSGRFDEESTATPWKANAEALTNLDRQIENGIEFSRNVAATRQDVEPVTPYEPQIGDLLWAGEELIRIIDRNSEQFLIERSEGVPITFSIGYVKLKVRAGSWRLASTTEQITALNREADQLDEVAANAIEQRAKVMQQIEALKAKH